MKKITITLICLCLAWLIHFQQVAPSVIRTPLRVDKLGKLDGDYYSRRAYITAEKDGRIILIPWFNVLFIEEVNYSSLGLMF